MTSHEPHPSFGWSDLAGVDVKAGLATTLQNEKLYRRLLAKFFDTQRHFVDAFNEARGLPDRTAAERCAHTLRGTAGNIGARDVQSAAGLLEQACKSQAQPAEIDALLESTRAALEVVLTGIQALNAQQDHEVREPLAAGMVVDEGKLQTVVAELRELLREGESGAFGVSEAHADLLQSAFPGHWGRYGDQLRDFDFESALETLESAMRSRPASASA